MLGPGLEAASTVTLQFDYQRERQEVQLGGEAGWHFAVPLQLEPGQSALRVSLAPTPAGTPLDAGDLRLAASVGNLRLR